MVGLDFQEPRTIYMDPFLLFALILKMTPIPLTYVMLLLTSVARIKSPSTLIVVH